MEIDKSTPETEVGISDYDEFTDMLNSELVKGTWLSEHIKRIQFCECNDTKMVTKENKIRFRKKLAKAKKERYMREHGCSRD